MKKLIAGILLSLVFVSPAWAGSGAGAYLFAEGGRSSSDIGAEGFKAYLDESGGGGRVDVNDSDTAWRAGVGYSFNRFLSVEGFYQDLGELGAELNLTASSGDIVGRGTARESVSVTGFGVQIVASAPVTDRFDVFATAGFSRLDGDYHFSYNESISDSSGVLGTSSELVEGSKSINSGMFGAGASYRATDMLGVFVRFTRYLDVGDKNVTGLYDVDLVTAGIRIYF